ncbi:MAG: hypothetical protein QW395_07035 [Candidatus Nitrosotenuis sp.]
MQSCGPSDIESVGISLIHSECLPFLQNQHIWSLVPPTEHDSMNVIIYTNLKT